MENSQDFHDFTQDSHQAAPDDVITGRARLSQSSQDVFVNLAAKEKAFDVEWRRMKHLHDDLALPVVVPLRKITSSSGQQAALFSIPEGSVALTLRDLPSRREPLSSAILQEFILVAESFHLFHSKDIFLRGTTTDRWIKVVQSEGKRHSCLLRSSFGLAGDHLPVEEIRASTEKDVTIFTAPEQIQQPIIRVSFKDRSLIPAYCKHRLAQLISGR